MVIEPPWALASHLPRCPIRSIVRPQLRQPCVIVSRIEIQRVTDEHLHVVARYAARSCR